MDDHASSMLMSHASVMIMNHCESSVILHHHASCIMIHRGSSCIMHDQSSPATMWYAKMSWGVVQKQRQTRNPHVLPLIDWRRRPAKVFSLDILVHFNTAYEDGQGSFDVKPWKPHGSLNLKGWRHMPPTWPNRPGIPLKRCKNMVLGHSRRHGWTRIEISRRSG